MFALLGVIAAIYVISLVLAAAGGVLVAVSPGFRRLLIGDQPGA